jgi:hypothetical protein
MIALGYVVVLALLAAIVWITSPESLVAVGVLALLIALDATR